jgi:hypothetical protein
MKKLFWGALLTLSVVVLLVLLASQVEQHIFRRRAELLLTQIQSLELGKTPWSEAQRQLKDWAGETMLDESCNNAECSVDIRLVEPVYGFIYRNTFFMKIDDYLRWRFKLTFDTGPVVRLVLTLLRGYMLLGGRPARIVASVGTRDGVVWSKAYSAEIQTYRHNTSGPLEGPRDNFALIAVVRSVPSSDTPRLDSHPGYIIRRQPGCCDFEEGHVEFTPLADPNDIHRLMELNLSCLTRLRPCTSLSDIMPAAWKQYLAENPGR